MSDDSHKRMRVWLVVTASIAVALFAWFWASRHPPFPPFSGFIEPRPPLPPNPADIELYYTLKTVISTLNATLLISLLVIYLEIYVRRKVGFTLWLTIICAVLLLDVLTSNPLVQWTFGFRAGGLGPFAVLPDVFKSIAFAILLYLTLRY